MTLPSCANTSSAIPNPPLRNSSRSSHSDSRLHSVALAYARSSPHQAEEITQAVFVILARKASHFRKGVILEGWLYQTTRLTALTHIRSDIRRARREQEAHMQIVLNENESEVWSQITPLLDGALAGLNETDRNAVVMRFFYGKSMKEIRNRPRRKVKTPPECGSIARWKSCENFSPNVAWSRPRQPSLGRFPPTPFKPRRSRWQKPQPLWHWPRAQPLPPRLYPSSKEH